MMKRAWHVASINMLLIDKQRRLWFAKESKLLIIGLILLVATNSCAVSHPLYPTTEEIKQHGFYLYVLPTGEVKRLGLSERAMIWSWDRHCAAREPTESYNPLTILYTNETEQVVFSIKIDPWDTVWNHQLPSAEVRLNSSLVSEHVAQLRADEKHAYLRFMDPLGIPVHVSSILPITETMSLIEQLEYVGPTTSPQKNPWDISNCPP